MKKNKTKYSWLLTPILACLMLTQASCSNDIAENTPETVPGGTYLTIVTRGINTTTPTEYEDYVGKLRILIFDSEGNKILNLPLTNGGTPDIPGHIGDASTDASSVVLDEQNIGSISSGFYTIYCIANEDGYSNTDDKSLSEILGAENIDIATLESVQVKFTDEDIHKPTTGNKYMLMSTKQEERILAGESNDVTIVLDRALAKAQLVIQSEEEISVTASLPQNKIPNSYSLIKQETIQSSSTFLDSSIDLEDGGVPFDNELFDGEEFSSANNKYVSQVVYLPERAAKEDNALYYNITIDDTEYNDQAAIAYKESNSIDYNIIRNYAYTTICTYDPAKQATLNPLTYTVQSWGTGGGNHTFN